MTMGRLARLVPWRLPNSLFALVLKSWHLVVVAAGFFALLFMGLPGQLFQFVGRIA